MSNSSDSEFDGECEICKEKIEEQEDHLCFVCGAPICYPVNQSFTMAGECVDCELWHYW